MIYRSRGEERRVLAKSQGGDAVLVMSENRRGRRGRRESIVDGDGWIRRRWSDKVFRFLVPKNRAKRRGGSADFMGFTEFKRSWLHHICRVWLLLLLGFTFITLSFPFGANLSVWCPGDIFALFTLFGIKSGYFEIFTLWDTFCVLNINQTHIVLQHTFLC